MSVSGLPFSTFSDWRENIIEITLTSSGETAKTHIAEKCPSQAEFTLCIVLLKKGKREIVIKHTSISRFSVIGMYEVEETKVLFSAIMSVAYINSKCIFNRGLKCVTKLKYLSFYL